MEYSGDAAHRCQSSSPESRSDRRSTGSIAARKSSSAGRALPPATRLHGGNDHRNRARRSANQFRFQGFHLHPQRIARRNIADAIESDHVTDNAAGPGNAESAPIRRSHLVVGPRPAAFGRNGALPVADQFASFRLRRVDRHGEVNATPTPIDISPNEKNGPHRRNWASSRPMALLGSIRGHPEAISHRAGAWPRRLKRATT